MEPRNDRPPTSGEVFWGYFAVGVLLLYVLVVMIRPTYDYLAAL